MGCYMKSIFEEDQEFSEGTYVTLMKTGTAAHARYIMQQRRAHGQ